MPKDKELRKIIVISLRGYYSSRYVKVYKFVRNGRQPKK